MTGHGERIDIHVEGLEDGSMAHKVCLDVKKIEYSIITRLSIMAVDHNFHHGNEASNVW